MISIKNWLEKVEEISPLPTDTVPVIKRLDEVKALMFDIYGTLLISSSGDIDQATISSANLREALSGAGYAISVPEAHQQERLRFLLDEFVKLIKIHQVNHVRCGRKFPEVDIRLVWEDLINLGIEEKIISKTEESDPDRLTFIFELLSNRVYPMPGFRDIIGYFREQNYPLGIISNAQFYTPIVMDYFITGEAAERESVTGFDPELTVFSYRLFKAKPDKSLFAQLLGMLREKYGIQPHESVFIGNDMYKDIYPAKQAGMKTILFAGDQRSLRLRREKPEVDGLVPDVIITELKQLKEVFVK
jgi:putative hydrolase of the HAD superfamily